MKLTRYTSYVAAGLLCAALHVLYAQEYTSRPINGPFGGEGTHIVSTPAGNAILWFERGGFYTSSDGGRRWHALNAHIDTGTVHQMFTDPVTGDAYCAFESGALYRLDESAQQWTRTGTLPYPGEHSIRGWNGEYFTWTLDAGVLKSVNGENWTQIYKGSVFSKPLHFAMAPNGTMFVGTVFDGVYRSSDGGATWKHSMTLTAKAWEIFVSPGDSVYAFTDFGTFGSGDWGATWESVGYPEQDSTVYTYPDSSRARYVKDEGMAFALPGSNDWQSTRAVLHKDEVRALFRMGGDTLAAATSRGAFVTDDGGESWYPHPDAVLANAKVTELLYAPDGEMYAPTGGLHLGTSVLRSYDGGRHWEQVHTPSAVFPDFDVSEEGTLALVYYDSCYVSRDEGATWQSRHLHYPASAVEFAENERLIIGTNYSPHSDEHYDSIYVSDDYGATISATLNRRVNSTSLKNYDRYVFCFGDPYSTDNGDTWQKPPKELGSKIGAPTFIMTAPDGGVFFGTSAGLVHGTGIEQPETLVNITSKRTLCVVAETLDTLLTGTNVGVYLSIKGATSVEDAIHPMTSRIRSVYPNPVTASATVRYTLESQSTISLKLVDVLGRTVAPIDEGRREPGAHSATVNTALLRPGTYFLRLETVAGVQTRPVAVVR